MILYCYIKTKSSQTGYQQRFVPLFSAGCLLAGILMILNVAYPIVSYRIKTAELRRKVLSPLAGLTVAQGQMPGMILGAEKKVDYSRLSNWYPNAPILPSLPTRATHYTISIPKLGIKDSLVQIGGEDLMKSVIHYPGTSLPGQYGNAVLFGHSVLPQFFNPRNYKTIFSTLQKMERGDEIFVHFDGIVYKYVVIGKAETTAEDVAILEQHYESEYLTLVTCVPPGTYLRRLIVKSQLFKI